MNKKSKFRTNPQDPEQQPNYKQVSSQSSQISNDSISVVSQLKHTKPLPFQKHTISYFMLIVSCICWVSGFVYANQNNMSPFETTISRYTIMIFVTYFHCRIDGSCMVFFNRPHEKTLFWRNVIISIHGFVVSIMQFYLPLSVFHTLVISGQIFILLANYLLKGVKITKNQMIGVVICFVGLAMIINGRFFEELLTQKKSEFNSSFQNYFATDIYTQVKMGFVYVGWNAIWAVSVVYTKMPEYSASQILFTQSTTSIIIGAIGYLFFDAQSHVSFEIYLPSIIFCGLIMIANYLFTYGLMWSANTGVASMMFMSSAIVGYAISIFRYDQQINAISLLGTVILIVSAGYVVCQQQKINS